MKLSPHRKYKPGDIYTREPELKWHKPGTPLHHACLPSPDKKDYGIFKSLIKLRCPLLIIATNVGKNGDFIMLLGSCGRIGYDQEWMLV